MGEIEGLLSEYEKTLRLPWERNLAGPKKVWFAIYEPAQERRVRFRIPEFEVVTRRTGHGWAHLDITDAFARWMANHEYREEYFQQPEDLDLALPDFAESLAADVKQALIADGIDEDTVVAISGVASLYGLMRVSALIEEVAPAIRGRLLVFFPGHHEGTNYRLLDARDGWNYLAIPISASKGA